MITFYKVLIVYIIGILLGFYFGWNYCITKEINKLKEINRRNNWFSGIR